MTEGRREGRALTQEMVFMRTKCNRMDLIKNLNLWGNDLQDISVIQSMPNLEVLSLSVNHVSTLVDLQHCHKLSELYLRKNEIIDLSEILYLRHLRRMKVLWLADNPCADLPYYRSYILHHLPGLTKIDAEDVTEEERKEAQLLDFGGVDTLAGADPFADRADLPGEGEGVSRDEEGQAGQVQSAQGYMQELGQGTPLRQDRMLERPRGPGPGPGGPGGADGGCRQQQVSGRGHFRSAPAAPTVEDADLLEPRQQNADRRRGQGAALAWGGDVPGSRPEVSVPNGRKGDNILCAVLALVKELDRQGLEVVRRAVEQQMTD